MSVATPKTVNYDLPLDLHGDVRLKNGVKAAFVIIDAKMKQLQDQIDLLVASANDSNSLHVDNTLLDSNSQFGDDTP